MQRMKQNVATKNSLLAEILLPLSAAFILCLYAPVEMYVTNQLEFWFGLNMMLPAALLFFVLSSALLLGVLALSRRLGVCWYRVALAALLAVLLSLYVQGSFLVKGLPGMNGDKIDWNAASPERIKSIAVWAGITAAVFIAAFKFPPERFEKLAGIVGGVLLLLLGVTMAILLLTTRLVDKTQQLSSSTLNEFQLSEDENVIILLVDALDSDCVRRTLDSNEEFEREFKDFTYFFDAASGYPWTELSVPQILTGQWYENQEPFDEFTSNAMDTSPLIQELERNNYKIGLYEQGDLTLYKSQHEGRYENQIMSMTGFSSVFTTGKMLLKMAGVRYAPWDLKRFCYDLQYYSVSDQNLGSKLVFDWSDLVFYNELKNSNPITVVSDKCFRFIHLEGAHVPFLYDKDMNVIDGGTYDDGVAASLSLCKAYLQRLKESGVYDNSAIIIMSDHGYDEGEQPSSANRMNPFLLIKGRGESRENMHVSSAPVSYADITSAIVELTRGESAENSFPYKDGDERERRMLIYDYTDGINGGLTEYYLNGSASDQTAMTPSGKIY